MIEFICEEELPGAQGVHGVGVVTFYMTGSPASPESSGFRVKR